MKNCSAKNDLFDPKTVWAQRIWVAGIGPDQTDRKSGMVYLKQTFITLGPTKQTQVRPRAWSKATN